MANSEQLSSRNWFGRASAGVILGMSLAIGLSGLMAWFGPGGLTAGGGKLQFNMWMVSPLWLLILSLVFLFRTGPRAWFWLGLVNLLCFVLLFGGRALLV